MTEIKLEHQPWHLGYLKSGVKRPAWTTYGMPELFEDFLKLVPRGGDHLDVGCGDGIKTVNFALAGLHTVGIDVSTAGFEYARKLIKKKGALGMCQILQRDCLDMPFKDQSFSSASDLLCFTHRREEEEKKYLRELGRVLKDGAYVLMLVFSDKDKNFYGHTVSSRYIFEHDPNNPLMEAVAHYHGMINHHFNEATIVETFSGPFRIVKMVEVVHPRDTQNRFQWNVIIQKQ